MTKVKACAKEQITVASDAKSAYPAIIKSVMPNAHINQRISRGKSKAVHDPMFTLNHTCALLRHDLSRLSRKTWVTTKKAERLQMHLDLYIAWQNKYKMS
jgi:hypothetical protein